MNYLHSRIFTIILSISVMMGVASCDVHEFPDENAQDPVPFTLHLDFDTELPLYTEVPYTRSGSDGSDIHDIRYIVNAYRIDKTRSENREVDAQFVFTKSDISNLNHSVEIELPEGNYELKVWADYVNAGSQEDKYYNTKNFSEITLSNKENHPGSNKHRDAFRGFTTVTIINPDYYTGSYVSTIDNQARVTMKRPMGKFIFISTDIEAFLTKVAEMLKAEALQNGTNKDDIDTESLYKEILAALNLGDFKVRFRYNAFMPCTFNMFTDKPSDAWTGMTFESKMEVIDKDEITLGFDYIFVNGSETTLSISLEVYNKNGKRLSATHPINVPIVRSKTTLVRGEFLTSEATGGVAINPGYDGDDYNIEIK